MVQICLSRDVYFPGDEVKLTVLPSLFDAKQLLSVRCYGYLRLPVSVAKEIPDRDQYAFRDRPMGPVIPEGSMLLWWSPNFPVHVDPQQRDYSLVKLFLPYFLPPSLKGGLFEVCHCLEVTILGQMLTKRINLTIGSSEIPTQVCPAVGEGFEQFDYTRCPLAQPNTPHGRRCQIWNCVSQTLPPDKEEESSLNRTFRISFNSIHATEVVVFGDWASEGRLIVTTGQTVPITFRFDSLPEVAVKRISATIIRLEWILDESVVRETTVWESAHLSITPSVVQTSLPVNFPRSLCPSFDATLCGVAYRLLFEFRACNTDWLEPVLWSLPLLVRSDPGMPVHISDTGETEQVLADSAVRGTTRFTIFAPS